MPEADDSPEFWEWLIRKERKSNSNDSINGGEVLPLYIEIEDRPVNPENVSKDEKGSEPSDIIDFIIFEFGSN